MMDFFLLRKYINQNRLFRFFTAKRSCYTEEILLAFIAIIHLRTVPKFYPDKRSITKRYAPLVFNAIASK